MEKKSFLEDIGGKPESFREEEFIKQRKSLLPAAIVAIAIVISSVVLSLVMLRGATLPDMDGWNRSDVVDWADGNNIRLVFREEYSDSYETDVVYGTLPEAGAKMNRKDTLTALISKGADPEGTVSFPDLKGMTLVQLNAWIEENSLTGITVRKENSSVFPKDTVIDYEMVDGTESSFVRKDRVRVYVSVGPTILDETVSVPDFSNYDMAQVLKWAHDNEITLKTNEEFNDYVTSGQVVSQSIEGYTKMSRDDVLNVTFSLGKAIKVPDFSDMTRNEASETAAALGIQLQYETETSSETPGTVLSQDIDAGTKISGSRTLTLKIAEESKFVIVPDLIGMKSSEAAGLAAIQGISVFNMTRTSTKPEGTVVAMSESPGSEMKRDETLFLYISGGDILVPDLSAMTRPEADLWAGQAGASLIYVERYSSEYPKGELYGQNIVNDLVDRGTDIVVYVSLGKIKAGDFTGMTKLDVIDWQYEVNSKGGNIALKFHSVEVPGRKGNIVIDQTYRDELMGLDSRLDVWVTSEGRVTVPDFTGVPENDFRLWCERNGISYSIEDRYTSDYPKNVLFGQNFVDMRIPDGAELVIEKSSGRPWIPSFTGFSGTELVGWVNSENLKGAGLVLKISYEYSTDVPEGILIKQNISERFADTGTEIRAVISKGGN